MKQLLLILLLVIIIVVLLIAGPWILLYLGLASGEDPPKPKYSYGEFPFYLEYEKNGEKIIVKDKVIVKYDGIGLSTGTGKYIKWKQTLASGNDEVVLFDEGGMVRVFLAIREMNYNLDEKNENIEYINSFPNIIKEEKDGTITSSEAISNTKLYNIKIVKFEFGKSILK
ncbi:hypothetical protein [Paenibacillus herberti]|uniref:Uncharacterized protein n=1 Tax=Paenibacillus herberti TaxID=1619309 RepID=A0A229NTJ9_9BACL|nr:hypothetical protein [Paenibacillus herberti]OXM13176.1 hypothetical protein CGZ75_23740 [Paenibacillus herberti]